MEYLFYVVILAACIYVMFGIVHSTIFEPREIERNELPAVVEQEFNRYFPDFVTQSVKLHKLSHRYQFQGKFAGKPSQVTIALTPESELSILEYSQVDQKQKFQKLAPVSPAQISSRAAAKMMNYFEEDQAEFEVANAQLGLIGETTAYRIHFDSEKYRYFFVVNEAGELIKFTRKDAA